MKPIRDSLKWLIEHRDGHIELKQQINQLLDKIDALAKSQKEIEQKIEACDKTILSLTEQMKSLKELIGIRIQSREEVIELLKAHLIHAEQNQSSHLNKETQDTLQIILAFIRSQYRIQEYDNFDPKRVESGKARTKKLLSQISQQPPPPVDGDNQPISIPKE